MIKPIMKDVFFLGQKSETATKADIPVAVNLLDTLKANANGCVGMAANMIGVKKRIIVINSNEFYITMFNPEIIKCSDAYEIEEGCLSLVGTRKTIRYKSIEVKYQDKNFKSHTQSFTGWTAQIIQHEIDHCNGIVI